MIDQVAILEAFALLRKQCDPRGHDLLETLESLMLTEVASLNRIEEVMGTLRSNVVSMIDRYSVRV